jgi:hypothetical protein
LLDRIKHYFKIFDAEKRQGGSNPPPLNNKRRYSFYSVPQNRQIRIILSFRIAQFTLWFTAQWWSTGNVILRVTQYEFITWAARHVDVLRPNGLAIALTSRWQCNTPIYPVEFHVSSHRTS